MTAFSDNTAVGRERVAVIGAGVSGLTAAYILQHRYDVSLYDSEPRLGGHAHTHDVVTAGGGTVPVDTGFIVHNQRTYPLLTRLFRELGVASQPTEMSMSIRCEGCGLEYAGARGLTGLFAQPRRATSPGYLRMLIEVRRFHRRARNVLTQASDELTLGDFLLSGGFSDYFVAHFMVPMVPSVWSASPQTALSYPARYLFAFLDNHGMLSITGSPAWRTVTGGSRAYVERAVKHLRAVATATPVRAVIRHTDGVEIRDESDQATVFDRVVVATHADTALRLLADPTARERATLGAFGYSRNETWLHTDDRLLPAAGGARASWNYLLPSCHAGADRVVVSYDMNRLQALATSTTHLVTLNATDRIDPDRVLARMTYEHPIYTTRSVAAQRRLRELNDGTVAFAGAYHGWGFHEDGCRAGVAAAQFLGVTW
ncbi:MAG TPA: FAD-dependent oxidoreductase [Acidimicrobiales bacterium]|nr:FAD-dependent oxidoreductase [Acidimicrobiales bacterium]